MVRIGVKKSRIFGRISCPPSKSYSHRSIVISALTNGTSNLKNVLFSRDTIATINCCRMFGVKIEEYDSQFCIPSKSIATDPSGMKDFAENKKLEVFQHSGNLKVSSSGGRNGFKTPEDILNTENSGTTIRLLTSMSSLINEGYVVLTGDTSLRNRPMGDLIRSLNQLGVECFSSKTNFTPPIIVKGGGINGGSTEISGKISSQFVSSLLLSCIYAKNPVTIKILGNQVSKPYIISTMSTMEKFGIKMNSEIVKIERDTSEIIQENSGKNLNSKLNNVITEVYNVPFEKKYTPTEFKVPGDFSTAALLISSAILSEGELIIDDLDFIMPQGDSEIINILKIMGGEITTDPGNGSIKVNGSKNLDGGEFNLKNTPDLLPVVSILALKSKNKTIINGITHARYKETDRVANISSQLVKFGATVKDEMDSMIIDPPLKIKNADVNSFGDHRLFMAFTIAGLASENSIIDGAESVDVSYPNFVNEMKKIGANIEYIV